MRDCDIGEVGVDSLYNLIIVVSDALKLEVKVVQPRDELYFRRVAFDNNKLLGEEPFDDKAAAVVLQSCLAKHLLKANVLFFVKPERVFVTRRPGL